MSPRRMGSGDTTPVGSDYGGDSRANTPSPGPMFLGGRGSGDSSMFTCASPNPFPGKYSEIVFFKSEGKS